VSQAPTYAPTASSTTVQPSAPFELNGSVIAPSDSPTPLVTTIPTEAPIQDNVVRIGDHFMSFVAPRAARAPIREEYDEMVERISNWFEEAISNEYNDSNVKLLKLNLRSDFRLFGLNKNIPPRPEDFNIYINFDYADYLFEDNNNSNRSLPSPDDLFKVVRRSITTDFILNVVRSYTGTPFESTNEVYLAALKP
jgi:hypothetical protein